MERGGPKQRGGGAREAPSSSPLRWSAEDEEQLQNLGLYFKLQFFTTGADEKMIHRPFLSGFAHFGAAGRGGGEEALATVVISSAAVYVLRDNTKREPSTIVLARSSLSLSIW
ncbi:MAG: hypothetical protein OK454_11165 [Thaumarchaeota archaeon]|nr:hypothetical protein [Nitrososphaerota archaeon]